MELGYFTYKKTTTGFYKNTQQAVKDFQKNNGHAGVLTDRNPVISGNFEIFFQLMQNLPAQGGVLFTRCFLQTLTHVRRQSVVCLDAHLSDGIGNHFNI